MDIFIGWSGETSRIIAEGIYDWIPSVLQNIEETFISTRDIDKGLEWFNKISDKLKETQIGVFCITPENLNSTWMHFEAGAISVKDKTNVCPVLFKVRKREIESPLSHFQMTDLKKGDMIKLIETINNKCPSGQQTSKNQMKENFEVYWNKIEKSKRKARKKFNDMVKKNQVQLSTKDTLETYLKNLQKIAENNLNLLKNGEFRLSDSQVKMLEDKLSPSFSPIAIAQLNQNFIEIQKYLEREENNIEDLKTKIDTLRNPINHIVSMANPVSFEKPNSINHSKFGKE